MQHPRPVPKVFDLTKGLDGLLVLSSDLADRLDGWPLPLLVMDFETNGSSAARDEIVELAAIRIEAGREVLFSTVLRTSDPGRTDLHGITTADQRHAPTFAQVVPVLRLLAEGCTLVSHHTTLDRFVAEELARLGGKWSPPHIDSLKVVRAVYPDRKGRGTNTLYNLCDDFGIPNLGFHLATGDVLAVAHLCAVMNEARPAEVAAAVQKVLKRGGSATTWPDLPLPDTLTAAVRMPQPKDEDYQPVPASEREDFVPEDDPRPVSTSTRPPAERRQGPPPARTNPVLFAVTFLTVVVVVPFLLLVWFAILAGP